MSFILILLLLMAGGGAFLWFRKQDNANPASLTSRLARYSFSRPQSGDDPDVSQAAGRQRSEQGNISRSVERFASRGRFGRVITARLERADLKWSPGEFAMIWLVAFLIAMLAGLVLRGTIGLLALGIVGIAGPWFYLGRRSKKRRDKFLDQLSDMAQMMGNSMRAGFSIIQSMEMVASEGPSPSKEEFERVTTEVKLGLPLDQALNHLLLRMPSEDLELAIVAINVQRQVGGNLAEILMVISKTVRDRVRFKRDLRALTSQARYSSYIITALPVAVAVVINLIDHPYESYLYTTTVGHLMIAVAVTMLSVGFFFLNKIANIEV